MCPLIPAGPQIAAPSHCVRIRPRATPSTESGPARRSFGALARSPDQADLRSRDLPRGLARTLAHSRRCIGGWPVLYVITTEVKWRGHRAIQPLIAEAAGS